MPGKILFTLTLSVVITALTACGEIDPNAQIDEGKITGDLYTSSEIGWTMHIPKGWAILTRDQVDSYQDKGKQAIEGEIGVEVDTDEVKNLLSLKKDRLNIFQSTSQPFVEEYPGEWKESNKALKQLLVDTYQSKGIGTTVTDTTTETIDGITFETYEFTLRKPDGKEFLWQLMYSSLVNGYDFGMNITYSNEQSRDEILSAWRASRFTQ